MRAAGTWHERHRELLAGLAATAMRWPRRRPSGLVPTWRRTFGRIELDREHYATLVLERSEDPDTIVLVRAFEQRPRGGERRRSGPHARRRVAADRTPSSAIRY